MRSPSFVFGSVIYFVRDNSIIDRPRIKIGYTKDLATLQRRMKTFDCANPSELDCLLLMEGDRHTEARIHKNFLGLRIHSRHEWFWFTGSLAGFVSRAAGKDRTQP